MAVAAYILVAVLAGYFMLYILIQRERSLEFERSWNILSPWREFGCMLEIAGSNNSNDATSIEVIGRYLAQFLPGSRHEQHLAHYRRKQGDITGICLLLKFSAEILIVALKNQGVPDGAFCLVTDNGIEKITFNSQGEYHSMKGNLYTVKMVIEAVTARFKGDADIARELISSGDMREAHKIFV